MRRVFFIALTSLVALFVGCTEGSLADDQLGAEILSITTDASVWFDVEGGSGEIGYEVENATNATRVSALSAEAWITDVVVGQTISYRVTRNDSSVVRRGRIRVACGESEQVVYVMQHPSRDNSKMSTLNSDYEFNIEGGIFVGAYVGDYFSTGCNTCQVYLWEDLDLVTGEERGDTFQLDLQLPLGGQDICGVYTEGTSEGHFLAGTAENVGGQYMQQNTWYMAADYSAFAPLKRGTITVESSNNVDYTFTLDLYDDYGYRVHGVFVGYGEFTEW